MKGILLPLALLLAACAGSGASTAAGRCQPGSAALTSAVASGLKDDMMTITNPQVVKSNDFAKAYFVSADLAGPGPDVKSQIATWVTDDADGNGLIFAVDGFAEQVSAWGPGDRTDAHFAMSDDGANESASCARR